MDDFVVHYQVLLCMILDLSKLYNMGITLELGNWLPQLFLDTLIVFFSLAQVTHSVNYQFPFPVFNNSTSPL